MDLRPVRPGPSRSAHIDRPAPGAPHGRILQHIQVHVLLEVDVAWNRPVAFHEPESGFREHAIGFRVCGVRFAPDALEAQGTHELRGRSLEELGAESVPAQSTDTEMQVDERLLAHRDPVDARVTDRIATVDPRQIASFALGHRAFMVAQR